MKVSTLLAAAVTGVKTSTAALHLCRPGFWTDTALNPHSDQRVFRRRRDAALFRLDAVAQNVLDRNIGRARWTDAVQSAIRDLPPGQVRTLEQLDPDDPELAARLAARLARQRPVHIPGALLRAPGFAPWDFERFISDHGDERVLLSCPVADGYRGPLRDLDIPGVYLHNSEVLLHRHPDLLAQTGFPHVARTLARPLRFTGVMQLFAGRRDTGTFWHCAGGMSFFLMLAGRKHWRFIDPAQSPLLFPRTAGEGRSTYWFSDNGRASSTFDRFARFAGSDGEAARNPVYDAAFAKCSILEAIVEPGDVLFVPAWWWHDVANLSESSIGMASRWALAAPTVSNPTFDVASRLNVPFFFRMARSVVGQQVVGTDGELLARDAVPLDTGVAEPHTRGNAVTQFIEVDATIDDYYRRHGRERGPG